MSTAKKRKLNSAGAHAEKKPKPYPPPKRPAREPSTPDDSAPAVAPPAATRHAEPPAGDAAEAQPQSKKSFRDLGVIEQLCEACEQMGYKEPTAIQREAIPLALEGRDIIGIAETGSGKTAAYALPILQALMAKPQPLHTLVLAPTRELAYQISDAVTALGSLIAARSAVLVGGMDMVSQAIALGKKPHVVVATPGRLLDHLENTKGFSLRHLKYLVLDEADRLLDLAFGPVIDKILRVLPPSLPPGSTDPNGRHTALYSATLSSEVASLQRASLRSPVKVDISTPQPAFASASASNPRSRLAPPALLRQSFLLVPHKHKDLYLTYLVSAVLPGARAIVFVRTVAETLRLACLLRALGVPATAINGQMSQAARLGALNRFKASLSRTTGGGGLDASAAAAGPPPAEAAGNAPGRSLLVATDVAARGLDIPAVDAVLNYDLPGDSATYVHRVGRTARAGRGGRAISLVCQYDVEVWQRIEAALGKQVPEEESCVKEEVLVLGERVGEAQRIAVREVRSLQEKGAGARKRRREREARDEMDREER
ncbi:P-loop containing nucleoside triphosphate hydrolase protein [Lineolata rhizophorae]|uniref:P-loop containing nucleoside triphosphate hydrolase protein n=1 Tax=Lineolata rhizophorae TaxID=578093 RepID=A0A6A6P165_9PEZI|nr:P-loop containing nucleoside triphosphate hydrolase protein [Lineolata rhizophorae]